MSRLSTATRVIFFSTVLCLSLYGHANDTSHNQEIYPKPESVHEQKIPGKSFYSRARALSLSSDLTRTSTYAEKEQIRHFGPWLTGNELSHNAQQLIRAIQDSHVHGLNPESYGFSEILYAAELLTQASHEVAELDMTLLGYAKVGNKTLLQYQLDQLLDDGFMKLARHLGQGVVNGQNLQSRFFRELPSVDAEELLASIYNAEQTVTDALTSISQSHPDYLRLTRKMRDLITEQATGVARTTVSSENDGMRVTQTADNQSVKSRLFETGDLAFENYLRAEPETEVENALQAFQARMGLEISNTADEASRNALSRSIEDDITSVALSLERWRWLPRDFGKQHVFINIPAFHAELVKDQETTLSMRTVVGSEEHPTPSFSRDMTYIEYNPTWTVPGRIKNDKLIPKERENPGYLESRNFEFLKHGKEGVVRVPASAVSREDFNAEYFPYILRQRGGSGNALGRMKFMMPNQHAIYMHDTPAKHLFSHQVRAYSNGCVRLENPDTLAQHLMLADGYSQGRIDSSMRSKATHRIMFRQPVPTHYVYLTTRVDANGALQLRPDIYSHDEKLAEALREADTLLSVEANLL